ncbi:MAG: hypothetical protein P8X51_15830 [Maritimibacter sp.]
MKMLLEVEGKRPEQVREFAKVEAALRELDAISPHSFASLTRQDGSYVQVAGGKQLCLVEKRDLGENTHWRAYHAEMSPSSGVSQVLKFGGGQMTMAEDEVFTIDDVISIWRAFFETKPFPAGIMWRDMTEMFRSS